VAADALGVDPRTVRTYIRRGLLDAKVEGEGVEKAYSVDIDSLYALRDSRKSSGKGPRKVREKSAKPRPGGDASEDLAELVRDLTTQLVSSTSEAADLRARLQLTERAQSTLEAEAKELREERDRLRAELEAERARGFWSRLFGS
jgi:DNA-binding transcriptional MerR regulator